MSNKKRPTGKSSSKNKNQSPNHIDNCYKKELSRLINKFRKRGLGEIYIIEEHLSSEYIYIAKLRADDKFLIKGKAPDPVLAKEKLVLNLCSYLKNKNKLKSLKTDIDEGAKTFVKENSDDNWG